MEKYGKIDSKAKALDYAIRDCELKCNNLKYGYETKEYIQIIYQMILGTHFWRKCVLFIKASIKMLTEVNYRKRKVVMEFILPKWLRSVLQVALSIGYQRI